MSDDHERLARIETHLEYIRKALETSGSQCMANRAALRAELAPGAEFAMSLRWLLALGAKLIAIAAAVAGIVKVALALN